MRQQYRPVNKPYLVGVHTEEGERASVKVIPFAAKRLKNGVGITKSGFNGAHPDIPPHLQESEKH